MPPSQGDDEKSRDEQGFQASHLNKWKRGIGLGLPLDGVEAILTETRGPGKSLSSASAQWCMDTPFETNRDSRHHTSTSGSVALVLDSHWMA